MSEQAAERAATEARDKFVSGLRARLALARDRGYVLNATDRNGRTVWLVSRWGLHRELPDLAAVEAFAQQVGAA